MEDKEIVQVPIGQVGKFDLKFAGGELVAETDAAVAIGSVGLVMKLDAGAVIDAIKKAIPGTVDDMILDVIKAALLGK